MLNRLYFVSKYAELSQTLCGLALSIRTLMSVFLGLTRFESDYFKRAAGNLAGALLALKGKWEAARAWEERGNERHRQRSITCGTWTCCELTPFWLWQARTFLRAQNGKCLQSIHRRFYLVAGGFENALQ